MRLMTDVVVEFHGEEPPELRELAAAHPDELTLIESKGFGATEYTVQVLAVAGSTGVLRSLITVARAHIESKRHISIKAEGVELQGLSARDAGRVLEHLADHGRLPEQDGT
jgi:hypothetical protein